MLITGFALADSIDPCFFVFYSTLLASMSIKSPGRVRKISFTFISAVYLGYFLFVLLIRNILVEMLGSGTNSSSTAPVNTLNLRYIPGTIAICYGLILIALGVFQKLGGRRHGEVCREGEIVCTLISKLGLDKLKARALEKWGYIGVGLLGLVSSWTLLPCSAGLMFLYALLYSGIEYPLFVLLTAWYTLIFVTPLVLIGLAFEVATRMGWLSEWLIRRQPEARVIGGLLAVAGGFYAIYPLLFR